MTQREQIQVERRLLERLVKIGNRFRSCPIVDDDFPGLRNEFDALLCEATAHVAESKPVTPRRQRMYVASCLGMQETVVTVLS